MGKPKKYRLQFDLSEEDYEAFKELQQKSKSSTNAALVARSLSVFKWVLEQRQKGNKLAVVDGADITQVELLTI